MAEETGSRLEITNNLSIPMEELNFTASRSSGPGGQNVNKVSTRVTLSFDVQASSSLTEEQKRRIFSRLSSRINKEGHLKVVSQETRSQWANREAAAQRLAALIRDALRTVPPRKKTKIPRAVHQRRLTSKKQRGRIKAERARRPSDDE